MYSGVGPGVASGVGSGVASKVVVASAVIFAFGVVVTSKEAFASETSLLPELEVTSGGDAVASAVLAVYSILVVSTRQSTTPSPSLSTKDPSYSPK